MPTAANDLRLDDGFSTIITIANLPSVKMFEKEVTPPGYQAGGAINTTTMRNVAYRTAAPKKLKALSNMTSTVAYATSALADIWDQIGVNQLITVQFPDGASIDFYGWIDDFKPGNHTEGEQPTAVLTVIPSMRDADGVEQAPVYHDPVVASSGALLAARKEHDSMRRDTSTPTPSSTRSKKHRSTD